MRLILESFAVKMCQSAQTYLRSLKTYIRQPFLFGLVTFAKHVLSKTWLVLLWIQTKHYDVGYIAKHYDVGWWCEGSSSTVACAWIHFTWQSNMQLYLTNHSCIDTTYIECILIMFLFSVQCFHIQSFVIKLTMYFIICKLPKLHYQ